MRGIFCFVLWAMISGASENLGLGFIIAAPLYAFLKYADYNGGIRYTLDQWSGTNADDEDTYTPEPELPDEDGVILGEDIETGGSLFLPDTVRGKHLYLIGKTRTGKTTLIKNLIIQDMQQFHGIGFVDPHGDAAEELLANVPEERIDDVLYFDPTKPFCPRFNIFELPYPPYKLTEDILSVFKLFFDSWGPRMEHVMRYACLTLLSSPNAYSLLDLRRLLSNPTARQEILSTVTDEAIQDFWEHEYPSISRSSTDAVLNKLSAFLVPDSPMFQTFSQRHNDLDFPAILDGKILIVNLAKGKLGDEPSRLLGGFFAAAIAQAGLARAEVPMEQRTPFFFYVDEFQNYAVDSFQTVLSEAAKYRLFLTLAHQTLGQIKSSMEHAIFGNVATLVSFQISADDATKLKREMGRSRLSIRIPETLDYVALDDFVAYQKEELQRMLKHKRLGISKAEDDAMMDKLGGFKTGQEQARRRAELQRNLETLNRPDLNERVLRELFPDFEFRQEGFPDTADFVNMQPYHALCRVERAENIHILRTAPAPEPVPGVKGQILHHMRELHAAGDPHIVATPRKVKPAVAPETAPRVELAAKPQPVAVGNGEDSDPLPRRVRRRRVRRDKARQQKKEQPIEF